VCVLAFGVSRLLQTPRNAASDVADSPGDLLLRNPITGIAGCCARAGSGQAAAAPPSSVMNWRRLMSGMGSPPEPAVPAYRTLRMPRKRPEVLGVDLNRSESPSKDSTRGGLLHCGISAELVTVWVISDKVGHAAAVACVRFAPKADK
jgi:hypothetical protein